MRSERDRRTDKSGTLFEVTISSDDDFPFLLEMYSTFSPKPGSQGLPPVDPEACQTWLKKLYKMGKNLLAWRGGIVIGHASLVPDNGGKSGEFIIFIDQNHRNIGIGTELTRFTLEKSGQLGFDSIWLTVSISNIAAVKLYRKMGFQYLDKENFERMMSIRLTSTNHKEKNGGGRG
jgi:RimJ/RimL family protein N-acetyltransferase